MQHNVWIGGGEGIMNMLSRLAIVTLIGSLSISVSAAQVLAQKSDSDKMANQPFTEDNGPAEDGVPPQAPSAPTPQSATTDADGGWHFIVSPYLWFAGMHGTVGARGHDVSVHADFSDIFKYFNIGLMGAVEPRHKKFGAPVDFIWMKLSDDQGLPFEVGPTSIKVKINQTLLSPKVAYRLLDSEKIKIDGNFGIRYFHLGTTLTLEPAGVLPTFDQSANWVDCVGGGRILATLSPKVLLTILGDAGAGGADLDYQVGGGLGYKIKPNMMLQVGWRYLDVNYRPKSTFVYDTATNGLLIGMTFNVK
jgi:hypothetical protein